ncbi:class I SAM-dependent methyltransferase, partial [Planctomycetota bacterium]
KGYQVRLIDPVPLHIEQAKTANAKESEYPLTDITLGDSRSIDMVDQSVDVVLFFGPLYHLTEQSERLASLREAYRVLTPGGIIFGAGISRYASFLDGISGDLMDDADFVAIVREDLKSGQHRNPTDNPNYFTTSFFHTPEELKNEFLMASFKQIQLIAIEGPAGYFKNFDELWGNKKRRNLYLSFIREIETGEAMLGSSCHIMAIGKKQ